jgi:2-desacetyl-2-hydroxyethyl bacteriochlorophyllide A dehydrogenase
MKSAVFHQPYRMTVDEGPVPTAGPDDIVLRVHACGICGSDLHGYRAGLWVEPGEIMGHEWAGEVTEVGANVRHLRPGDRVTVGNPGGGLGPGWEKSVGYGLPGAYAEYVRIPGAHVPGRVGTIPEELSYDEAAALEPLRCALHAVHLAAPNPDDWAVVIGVGTIGLCCLQALRVVGGCRTIAIDISDRRLELATAFGADVTINARTEDVLARVTAITGAGHYRWGSQAAGRWGLGARVDCVIEAAGTGGTLRQALEMVKPGGTVVQIALFEEEVTFDPTIITQKQIRLQGSAGFGLAPYEQAVELVRTGQIRLKPLVTHRFPLDAIVEAFETQMNTPVSGKVIVAPGIAKPETIRGSVATAAVADGA